MLTRWRIQVYVFLFLSILVYGTTLVLKNFATSPPDYGGVQVDGVPYSLEEFLANADKPASVAHWPVSMEYVVRTISNPMSTSVDTQISGEFRGSSWAEWSDEVHHGSSPTPDTTSATDAITCVVNDHGNRRVYHDGCTGELDRIRTVPTVESAPNPWIRARYGLSSEVLQASARPFSQASVTGFDPDRLSVDPKDTVLVVGSGDLSCTDIGLDCGGRSDPQRWSQTVVIHGPTSLPLYAFETLGENTVLTFEVVAFTWRP